MVVILIYFGVFCLFMMIGSIYAHIKNYDEEEKSDFYPAVTILSLLWILSIPAFIIGVLFMAGDKLIGKIVCKLKGEINENKFNNSRNEKIEQK